MLSNLSNLYKKYDVQKGISTCGKIVINRMIFEVHSIILKLTVHADIAWFL
jgi:hypothetical protein